MSERAYSVTSCVCITRCAARVRACGVHAMLMYVLATCRLEPATWRRKASGRGVRLCFALLQGAVSIRDAEKWRLRGLETQLYCVVLRGRSECAGFVQ